MIIDNPIFSLNNDRRYEITHIEQFILNLEVEILHDYDLQRNIVTCLSKYANAGDNYLWENADSIYAMYTEILNEEGR